MMGDRVDIVREAFEAFNRRDLDAILERCHPQVEWTPPEALPGSRTYHGPAGVRQAIDDMIEIFPDLQAEPVRIVEEGDRVIGFYRWHGTAGESGASIDAFEVKASMLVDFEGEQLRVARFWTTWEEAIEAAGMDRERLSALEE
jgi:ketosteroid isomerase-like protein